MTSTIETLRNYFGTADHAIGEHVNGFGGSAFVAEVTGPDTARVKVRTFDPVHCYVQRDANGDLCAVRRVLISDIIYS